MLQRNLSIQVAKLFGMHFVPPSYNRNIMPPSYKSDLKRLTGYLWSKSNNYFETNFCTIDFVSCDNSDKAPDSETTWLCHPVFKCQVLSSSKTNKPLASALVQLIFKSVSETADRQQQVTTNDDSIKFHLKKDFQLLEKISQVVLRVPKKELNSTAKFVLTSTLNECHLFACKSILRGVYQMHRRMASILSGDNGTEFKISKLIELCGSKGIKRDYSNARIPQQNGVAERKNRTLIEAARTMLADSKLPTMFWTEAVSTACYVLNRVLVTRPHNKTPYELLSGKVPNISHLKPFGCHVTILNTSDHLGKFEGKADEGFIVGYAAHSKAYRVYNLSSKKIEETLNLRYLEDKPNVQGLGQEWYFDLDYLTDSLGYTRFKSNQPAGTQDPHIHAGTQDDSDSECDEQVIVVPSFPSNRFSGPKVHEASEMVESNSDYAEELARLQRQEHEAKDTAEKYGFGFSKDTEEHLRQADMVPAGSIDPAASISAGSIDPAASISAGSAEPFPTVIEPVHADETSLPPGHSLGSSEHSTRFPSPSDLANSISSSSEMEDIYHHPSTGIFSSSSYDADFGGTVTNLAPIVAVDPVPTKRVNTIHPQSQILGDLTSPVQTRGTLKKSKFGESTFVSYVHDQQRNNHTDYLHCLFACFLSQLEPSSVAQALNDSDWVEAMQEEMQQFINQKVWKLVPLPDGKIAIGTKWILKNKRDARGIVVRNKARLVAQGHRQEEGIDYDEVFAPVARIEAIRLFLAFASYMGFMVYQMDVKSAFLYGEIDEEVYVTQPKGFEDPHFPKHVYKVVKALYGLHQAPRAWSMWMTLYLGLQRRPDVMNLSQDKYIQDILKKFDMESVRTATTPYEASKPKSKDKPDDAVNVHLYRSMIGSLMYLTASRPDIMFAVSACSRHQVTPLTSNLNAVKKIFKYLKGQPKLGLWYPRDSPFVLEAYSDSDYAGSHGDRKSTTGGCQFLGRRLISWQCKKQTIVATSSTEAEYVAAANCCGQLLKSGSWDQFGTPLAIALICLCEGKKYNWSRYIFTGMTDQQDVYKYETEFSWRPYAIEPVHQTASPHDHGSTSPRPTTTTPATPLHKPVSKNTTEQFTTFLSAQVNQHGPSSDPHVESSSKDNASNTDLNVADDPLGGSFFASPSRSPAAPPEGTTSGGVEDLLTLTALYTLVSERGEKIRSLESELQAHKLLFKDVMGKLVKRVKILESKLKARGRNVILSESDNEEDEEQDVDSLIKLAKAAAIAADTSSVPADATQATEFPPSSSIHTDAFVHGNAVPTGTNK
ncbi:putative ribonuclease H-like domain-containing protein [Tanacetum coccineum]